MGRICWPSSVKSPHTETLECWLTCCLVCQEEQASSAKGLEGRQLESSQLAQKLQEAEAALQQQGIEQRREQATSLVGISDTVDLDGVLA